MSPNCLKCAANSGTVCATCNTGFTLNAVG